MTSVVETANPPVRKSVTVSAGVERAFHVFTDGFDTWWPRSHSIGGVPLQKAVIEGKAGGRCYQLSIDGSECDWGRILVWDPPSRFVIAWHLNPQWEHEPDATKASEVEITLQPRAGRIDSRRPRASPSRSPRRRRRSGSPGRRFAGGLGRPAADVRGRCRTQDARGARSGLADLQAEHGSAAHHARWPFRRRALAASDAADQPDALDLRPHRADASDDARDPRRSVRYRVDRSLHPRLGASRGVALSFTRRDRQGASPRSSIA